MPHSSEDARKKFILTTIGNFHGIQPLPSLADSQELNNFLDDGNEFVLSIIRHDNDLHLSNKVKCQMMKVPLRCKKDFSVKKNKYIFLFFNQWLLNHNLLTISYC